MPATPYSPTIKRSTIGEDKLNFSVRNGKRCTLISIITGKLYKWTRNKILTNRADQNRRKKSSDKKPPGKKGKDKRIKKGRHTAY
jgi:hypothetical protein